MKPSSDGRQNWSGLSVNEAKIVWKAEKVESFDE